MNEKYYNKFFSNTFFNCSKKIGKPFINGAANLIFVVNENYTFGEDDGENFIVPSAIFLRTGFGYEIKKRVAFSLISV